jgi:predicted DNA-binding antitoxin AbrB/MazE fold protein
MRNIVRAIVREGRIELLEKVELPEGAEALVTVLPEDQDFWAAAGEVAMKTVWGNDQDDVYAELLQE